jgi:hypothetical protein
MTAGKLRHPAANKVIHRVMPARKLETVPDAAGMGRLNRVLVAIPDGVVVIPSDSRDALLEELRPRDDAQDVIAAFEAAGATRPVELDVYGQVVVVETIRAMAGVAKLPDGLSDLLAALADELHTSAPSRSAGCSRLPSARCARSR